MKSGSGVSGGGVGVLGLTGDLGRGVGGLTGAGLDLKICIGFAGRSYKANNVSFISVFFLNFAYLNEYKIFIIN